MVVFVLLFSNLFPGCVIVVVSALCSRDAFVERLEVPALSVSGLSWTRCLSCESGLLSWFSRREPCEVSKVVSFVFRLFDLAALFAWTASRFLIPLSVVVYLLQMLREYRRTLRI